MGNHLMWRPALGAVVLSSALFVCQRSALATDEPDAAVLYSQMPLLH